MPEASTTPAACLRLMLDSERETVALAARISASVRSGDVIALKGPLGVGKTAFARAFIHALGIEEEVPSPTFALVQIYDPPEEGKAAPRIWHFDFYRIESPAEVHELGFDEALDDVALIEWPEKLGPLLPDARLELEFAFADEAQSRQVTVRALGESWRTRLAALAGIEASA